MFYITRKFRKLVRLNEFFIVVNLFSLLSKCMKKVRQKKTLTGEMQTKNSLFRNPKIAYL